MSIILKLACRYLSEYRRRSLSMTVGIALSVFLIVVIGSLSISVRNANVISCRNDSGPQHVIYRDRSFNLHDLETVQSSPQVKNWAALFYYGAWQAPTGHTVNVLAADRQILYMNSTSMQAGRFPADSGEIAMEAWVFDRLHLAPKLGQIIPIHIRGTNQVANYQVVGIIKDRTQTKSSGHLEAYVAFNQENLQERNTQNNAVNLLVEFKDQAGINRSIKQMAAELGLKVNQDTVVPHKWLLTALGQMDAVDWYLVSVALMLMLVGGMVIYSIYSISVLKRVQDYGMLRAIGATPWQIILIMLIEIAIQYTAGTVLGMVGGGLFVQLFKGVTTSLFIPSAIEAENLKLNVIMVSPFAIKLSLLAALGAILAAAVRAALMTVRVSPLAAMNRVTQDNSIRLSNSRLEQLVSMPHRISLKYLKRNKKALVFIIIAVSAGCTLFMVESFKAELFNISSQAYASVSTFWSDDFCLNVNETAPMLKGYSSIQIDELRRLAEVDRVKAMQVLYSRLKLTPDQLNGVYGERYIKYMNQVEAKYSGDERITLESRNYQRFALYDENELVMQNTILGMSDSDMAALERVMLAGKHRISAKSLPHAVVYVPRVNPQGTLEENEGVKMHPVLNIREGDRITVTFPGKGYQRLAENADLIYNYRCNKSDYIDREVLVAGVIHTLPERDETLLGNSHGPYLFISDRDLQKMTGIKNYRIVGIKLKHPNQTADYRLVKAQVEYLADLIPGTFVSDKFEFHREIKRDHQQYMLLIGAIALILILISGLSIYTNIYYDLISRQREFAIMRAIGLTRRQFRSMIHFEGMLYGTIAALASIIISLVIEYGIWAYYLYTMQDPYMTRSLFVEWKSILLVLTINLIVGYIATLSPARQLDKANISAAIRAVE